MLFFYILSIFCRLERGEYALLINDGFLSGESEKPNLYSADKYSKSNPNHNPEIIPHVSDAYKIKFPKGYLAGTVKNGEDSLTFQDSDNSADSSWNIERVEGGYEIRNLNYSFHCIKMVENNKNDLRFDHERYDPSIFKLLDFVSCSKKNQLVWNIEPSKDKIDSKSPSKNSQKDEQTKYTHEKKDFYSKNDDSSKSETFSKNSKTDYERETTRNTKDLSDSKRDSSKSELNSDRHSSDHIYSEKKDSFGDLSRDSLHKENNSGHASSEKYLDLHKNDSLGTKQSELPSRASTGKEEHLSSTEKHFNEKQDKNSSSLLSEEKSAQSHERWGPSSGNEQQFDHFSKNKGPTVHVVSHTENSSQEKAPLRNEPYIHPDFPKSEPNQQQRQVNHQEVRIEHTSSPSYSYDKLSPSEKLQPPVSDQHFDQQFMNSSSSNFTYKKDKSDELHSDKDSKLRSESQDYRDYSISQRNSKEDEISQRNTQYSDHDSYSNHGSSKETHSETTKKNNSGHERSSEFGKKDNFRESDDQKRSSTSIKEKSNSESEHNSRENNSTHTENEKSLDEDQSDSKKSETKDQKHNKTEDNHKKTENKKGSSKKESSEKTNDNSDSDTSKNSTKTKDDEKVEESSQEKTKDDSQKSKSNHKNKSKSSEKDSLTTSIAELQKIKRRIAESALEESREQIADILKSQEKEKIPDPYENIDLDLQLENQEEPKKKKIVKIKHKIENPEDKKPINPTPIPQNIPQFALVPLQPVQPLQKTSQVVQVSISNPSLEQSDNTQTKPDQVMDQPKSNLGYVPASLVVNP